MCGICGIVSADPITDSEPVRLMKRSLHHRGPDGEGEYHNPHIILAMRRLSIIDLTGGWQPLYNEDRSLVLICNGEIYNFIELRSQLESRGHRFNTKSDCETIVHLYEECGTDCVHHLRGMFAFALWDNKHQRLLLARDRMGEKPLYLYEHKGQLIFASELKALLRSGIVPFELDPVAVHLYFHYQYVPEPATAIKNVRKLPAAHILTIDINPWQINESSYWSMEDAPPLDGDPVELIRSELETISELIIRADVPVGVALSGGLDSSAIAALAAQKYPGTMHAFTIGYPGYPHNDERREARALADYLGIPFHDIELATEDMVAFFPELIYWQDDPIADISSYGYYAVMKLAREHGVPVILQGQGGDELFWGYQWVRQAAYESINKKILLEEGWKALLKYLKPTLPNFWPLRDLKEWIISGAGIYSGWQQFLRHKKTAKEQLVFYDLTPDFQMACCKARDMYSPTFVEHLDSVSPFDLFSISQPWPKIEVLLTRLICETYLMENGITQGERLSMASSVELRLPLVDYRLVETVVGLRKTHKDYNLPPKSWLKAALKDTLPDWTLSRPKRGFEPPVRSWHRALFTAYGNMLNHGYLVQAGILKAESAQHLSTGPFPQGTVTPLSFKALVLELWSRQFSSLSQK